MRGRGIELELVKQESVVVLLKQSELRIGVLVLVHALKDVGVQLELRNEGLAALSHQEHWEVVFVFFVSAEEVLENGLEGLLVLWVRDGRVAVTCEVNAVDLFQN